MQKSLAVALLLGAVQAEEVKINMQEFEQVVEGMLRGALDAEGFDDISKCLKDAEVVIGDVEAIYEDLEAHKASKILDALKKFANLMQTVKAGMSDCSHIKADWEKMAKMVEAFDSPTTFAWHLGKDLLVNGVDIWHEVNEAVADYKAAKWNDFGYQMGEAAAKTLIGAEKLEEAELVQIDKKEKVAKVFQGMLEAFGLKFNLENLLLCIYEEDQAALMLDIAVQSFQSAWKNKDWGDAIGGLIATVGAVQQFKQGLPVCKAINTDLPGFKQFEKTTDIAAHPLKHLEVIENDVKINGVAIAKGLHWAVEQYEEGNYENFGKKMGGILKLATEEPAEMKAVHPKKAVTEKEKRQFVAEVAQGFLEATNVGKFSLENLLLCIYEADQAALILLEGVQLLEEAYEDKSMGEAVGGLIAVVAFVQQLEQSLPVCKAIDASTQNWKDVDHIIEVAEHPEKHMKAIGEDIEINGKKITKEITEALESFKKGDYKKFGYLIGKTLEDATVETPNNLFLY